ncbi:hypothetical protein HN587_02505 [Candidatus Woesearchaeota archaeon]|jgi:hypothetical protein|nr:hypothetical protein [Candidatus Woesearchaeota archaeon]
MFTNADFDAIVASGLPQVILPMLIIFTVVYLVMFNSKIVGDQKSTKVVVALVMSLTFGVPHILGVYPADFNPVLIVNNIVGGFALFIFGILIAVLVLSFVVRDPKTLLKGANYIFFIPIILLLWVGNAYPQIFGFVLTITILIGIIALMMGQTDQMGMWLTIVIISLIIIHSAFGWPAKLPFFLNFLEDDVFQAITIVILSIMLIMSFIFKEPAAQTN